MPSKSAGHNPAEISETFALPELQMNPKLLIASLAHSSVASRGLDETDSFTSLEVFFEPRRCNNAWITKASRTWLGAATSVASTAVI